SMLVMADSATLTAGLVAAAPPELRGSAMGLYSLADSAAAWSGLWSSARRSMSRAARAARSRGSQGRRPSGAGAWRRRRRSASSHRAGGEHLASRSRIGPVMKLYFKPGACSLSPHIVLREAGLPFELVKVDTKAGLTAGGEDFKRINPKGYVPTLQIDEGQVLTEGVAIVQYLADRKPEAQLAPRSGSLERYRLIEWLNYIATELHKGTPPPNAPQEVKDTVREQRL